MTNLLPPDAQKQIRTDLKARFLLAASLVLLGCAVLCALALAPAEVALVFFPPPSAQVAQSGINEAQDSAAIAHTTALLAVVQPALASTSLSELSAALSDRGTGVTIDDISYSVSQNTLTLAGHAQTPDEVNTFRETLQSDLDFSNVSVPVSALIGSQGGGFTISMDTTQ